MNLFWVCIIALAIYLLLCKSGLLNDNTTGASSCAPTPPPAPPPMYIPPPCRQPPPPQEEPQEYREVFVNRWGRECEEWEVITYPSGSMPTQKEYYAQLVQRCLQQWDAKELVYKLQGEESERCYAIYEATGEHTQRYSFEARPCNPARWA